MVVLSSCFYNGIVSSGERVSLIVIVPITTVVGRRTGDIWSMIGLVNRELRDLFDRTEVELWKQMRQGERTLQKRGRRVCLGGFDV